MSDRDAIVAFNTLITGHARDMWHQRHGSGEPPYRADEAWVNAFEVGIPGVHGKTRLHAPTQTLFVYHDATTDGPCDQTVATVLHTYDYDVHQFCDRCIGCGGFSNPDAPGHRCHNCRRDDPAGHESVAVTDLSDTLDREATGGGLFE